MQKLLIDARGKLGMDLIKKLICILVALIQTSKRNWNLIGANLLLLFNNYYGITPAIGYRKVIVVVV